MSYGIICRALGCRNYADYRIYHYDKEYLCWKHYNDYFNQLSVSPQSERLTEFDHAGPEGMKSLKEQGKE